MLAGSPSRFSHILRFLQVFASHPLLTVDGYCLQREKALALSALNGSQIMNRSLINPSHMRTWDIQPISQFANSSASHFDETVTEKYSNEPNTALFCIILIIGTLFIATELRQFRNSKYLGRIVSTQSVNFTVKHLGLCSLVHGRLCLNTSAALLNLKSISVKCLSHEILNH